MPEVSLYEALQGAAPQLHNIGSFNPANLDPLWKPWLMRAERVFIDTFGGDYKKFFGAIATVYANAKEEGTNPEEDIQTWIIAEIAELDKKKPSKKAKSH